MYPENSGVANPLPEWSKVIRGLPAKQSGACVRRLRDTAASAYCAAFNKASGIIRTLFLPVWEEAWAAGPEVFGLQTAIMGRTIPYFGGFTSTGAVWVRPSTQAENEERSMRPAGPRPRRPDPRGGRRQDTQIEAMIVCKRLRAEDRSGKTGAGANEWLPLRERQVSMDVPFE